MWRNGEYIHLLAFLLRIAGNVLSNVLVFLLFLAVNFRQLNNKWISRKFSSLIWQCVLLFVCLIVCVCAQLCPTLGDPMDCIPPGSAANGVFQARVLEWVAISSSRRSSWPRDWTCVLCLLHWQVDSLPLHHLELIWIVCSFPLDDTTKNQQFPKV